MSNMLEQAIVDAEALKEAALENAEQAVIEKYQAEIKNAVEALLEQEEEDLLDEPLDDEDGLESDEDLAQQCTDEVKRLYRRLISFTTKCYYI